MVTLGEPWNDFSPRDALLHEKQHLARQKSWMSFWLQESPGLVRGYGYGLNRLVTVCFVVERRRYQEGSRWWLQKDVNT
jgi:hypothetical protein